MFYAMANKKLSAIITIGGEVAGSLRTAIGSTTSQLGKIGSEIQRVKKQQSLLGESIRTFGSMGKNVDNLRARYSSVTDELNRLTKAQEKLNRVEELRQKNASVRSTAGTVLGGTVAAGVAMVVPVKLAIDFESSMADVEKVFSGTDSQFKAINTEILKMSTTLPMAAKDIANIVASGAQSGIAVGELTKFAETAVKMGVAFDIGAEESGQAMAEMRTAFKMSQDEVTSLADKINFLGNSTPAAAKGIMEIVQRIGPLGEVGGFASGSIAALGATIRGMGVAEEVAATGIKNMMLALVAGESATKSQKAAYKDLGLDSEKVAKDMQVNAEATTLNVLKQVSKLDKYKQGAILKDLFGSESLGSIAPLLTNMEALEKNLNGVSQANKKAWDGSMQAEYEARANTTANKLQLLKNNTVGLGITIGTVLLPVVSSVAESMSHVIGSVTSWAQANPQLASTLTKVAMGAVAVVGGIAAVALGVTTVIGPIALAISSFSVLGGSAGTAIGMLTKMIAPIKMIGTVFGVVGKAMLANPMVLAIVAIVAVVAGAAYLIYKNWEPIKGFFSDLWSGVKSSLSEAWEDIKSILSDAWGGVKSSLSDAWEGIKGVFNKGIDFIKGVISGIDTVFANNPILNILLPFIGIPRIIIANWASIKGFFSSLWADVTNKALGAWNSIIGVYSQFSGWFSQKWGQVKTSAASLWADVANKALGAWNSITGVFSSIGDWFVAKWENVKLLTGAVWSGIKSVVVAAWNGLISTITNSSLFQSVVLGWTKIFEYLGTLKDKMLNIGKNIIDGLINGIKSGFEGLKTVWASINNYMPSFMKKKMDIHSPSRVMAGLGGFIVDGIGVGMQKRTPVLKQQFGGVLDTFNQSAPTLNLRPNAANMGSSNAFSGGGNSASDGALSQNITIIIHGAPGQDINQLADLVAQKINRAKAVIQRGSMIDAGYSQ